MQNDVLSLAANILTAAGAEPLGDERELVRKRNERFAALESRREHRKRLRLPDETDDQAEAQAFGGPLWNVRTPVPAGIVQRVIDYAASQEVCIGGVCGSLQSVKGTVGGLVVTIRASAWDRGVTSTTTIDYSTTDGGLERNLALGNWVKVPYGEVRLTSLLPTLKPTSYGAEIRIGAEFRRPGWFQRLFSARLDRIELHPTKARPVTDSKVKTLVLPDIVFIEKPAAMQVEGKR